MQPLANMESMEPLWEEIVDIEYIDPTENEYVYDFSVDDIETFTTAEGIIVHNTLNTFHQCGISSKSKVNQGVPRIRELLSISKKIQTPSLTVYLKEEDNTHEKAKEVLNSIESMYFGSFVEETSVWYDPDVTNSVIETDAQFVAEYYDFYDDGVNIRNLSPWVLRIAINPVLLMNKGTSMFEIYCILLEKLSKRPNLHIIYSDENAEHTVFHFRFVHENINKVSAEGSDTPATNKDQELLTKVEQDLMCNFLLKGVDNISSAVIRETKEQILCKETEEIVTKNTLVLDTQGTNLTDILQRHDLVDTCRTISNDIHEVYNTLGIEAAREILKKEIFEVLNQSGVYVNDAHVSLLVDNITLNGVLVSVNRYGISKSDNGVMSMASFEEPHEHFKNAAIHNTADKMESISANVSMGQNCKFGTGYPDLVFKPDKLLQNQHKIKSLIANKKEKQFMTFAELSERETHQVCKPLQYIPE